MPASLPLLAHTDLDSPLAWRRSGPISVRQFLADVRGTAALLPANRHLLNLCTDRYRFAVGLAAGLVTGKISLLPSTHTPETVRQLRELMPDVFCLCDQPQDATALPKTVLPDHHFPITAETSEVPRIGAEQTLALVFTSGSTGQPMPHRKTWGKLVGNVRAAADRLAVGDAPHHFVATVPAQHMYGFESSFLLPLLTGGSFWAGRPFYPADIADALDAVPQPRFLVTTPLHLRTLLDAAIALPPVAGLLSATAPLSIDLARRAETALAAPLQEIYGCTETGQLASRQPTTTSEWTLFDTIALEQDHDASFASGPNIEGRIALGDVLELTEQRRFILHGRSADLVNIAGKRTSLAYLNHQLTAIPGVLDGAFFYPDEEAIDGVTRLAACVVAPTLDRRTLELALRQRIESVFLPRPLHLVESLPRNATGKLPRQLLGALIEQLNRRPDGAGTTPEPRSTLAPPPGTQSGVADNFLRVLAIAADHPALAGHFPGRPIVPGVVLLDHALLAIEGWLHAPNGSTVEIANAKFLSPLSPGEPLQIDCRRQAGESFDTVRFDLSSGPRKIATGSLRLHRLPSA